VGNCTKNLVTPFFGVPPLPNFIHRWLRCTFSYRYTPNVGGSNIFHWVLSLMLIRLTINNVIQQTINTKCNETEYKITTVLLHGNYTDDKLWDKKRYVLKCYVIFMLFSCCLMQTRTKFKSSACQILMPLTRNGSNEGLHYIKITKFY
jgi:hypothetical protein